MMTRRKYRAAITCRQRLSEVRVAIGRPLTADEALLFFAGWMCASGIDDVYCGALDSMDRTNTDRRRFLEETQAEFEKSYQETMGDGE
jgi:hypothetical protein